MKIFLLVLGISLLSFMGLAIGYIISGKKIKGSCGGLGEMFGKCDACGNERCESRGVEAEDGNLRTEN